MEGNRKQIVIFGSGNVGSHLAKALDKTNDVIQIWSRSKENAERLAENLDNSVGINDLDEISRDADFYIIAVKDDAILDIAGNIPNVNGIIAHTSGSLPLNELKKAVGKNKCGVIYPLQTFTKDVELELREIPFFTEGVDEETNEKLYELATCVSKNCFTATSDERQRLHIAAISANNFTNYLWALAEKFLKENTNFDFTILSPLLEETLRKAIKYGPQKAQTGPAKRRDISTINTHLDILNGDFKNIYKLISDKILKDESFE